MSDINDATIPRRAALLLLAVAIGIITISLVTGIDIAVTGSDLNLREEIGVLCMQIGLVSFPFVVLSLVGIQDKVPWTLGIGLTIVLWGYYLFDNISSNASHGVNFGLALILFLSPAMLTIVCLLSAWLFKFRGHYT